MLEMKAGRDKGIFLKPHFHRTWAIQGRLIDVSSPHGAGNTDRKYKERNLRYVLGPGNLH